MENNLYIVLDFKPIVEESELDFVLYDEVLGENWDADEVDTWPSEIFKGEPSQTAAVPINIDKLITMLQGIKASQNATHICIEPHIDHQGYLLQGCEVSKATGKEVEEYESKIKSK